MTAEEQLEYESRTRPRAAALAALAGLLLVAAAIIQLSGTHAKVEELTQDLIIEHNRFPLDLIGAIINGLALTAVAFTLAYLFRITRARNLELRDFIRWLAIGGGVLSAISAVVYAVAIAAKASDFVHHGLQTYEEANHLTSNGYVVVLPLLAQLASLLLTAGFVMISLNAMRVGLLTRFMGYLGIFAGVLVLFPIGSPVPVVQGFWLLALAYLMLGRWPSGTPVAWASGKAEPWPSSAQMREQREKASGAGSKAATSPPRPAWPKFGKAKAADKPEAEPVPAPTPTRTRSGTPKRKRKRRN